MCFLVPRLARHQDQFGVLLIGEFGFRRFRLVVRLPFHQ